MGSRERDLYGMDAYGNLEYAVGTADDFVCFDWDYEPDTKILRIQSVVNSETGAFIQEFGPMFEGKVEDKDQAYIVAKELIDAALDWCIDNDLVHDQEGWNQDPYYFVRAVARYVKDHRIAWWRGARIVRGAKAHDWMSNS